MQPTEDKVQFKLVRDKLEDFGGVVRNMALLTAAAQLRSSGRQGAANTDELVKFRSDAGWQTGIIDYAQFYYCQVKKTMLFI